MSVTNITAENFNTEVLESEKPVLLDFWAPWCGPCRMFSSTVDSVAEERNDIKVTKISTSPISSESPAFPPLSLSRMAGRKPPV